MSKLKKAIDRAKEIRDQDVDTAQPRPVKATVMPAGRTVKTVIPSKAKDKRKEINITYTKSRRVNINPETLKKNRVFTHIHDLEVTDQINLLRAQTLKRLDEINGNSLMVTSVNPGEGKTFISVNLCISIAAELDRTVLLVDADLKNPLHKHFDMSQDFFGFDSRSGLADYLLNDAKIEDLIIHPGIDRLTVLPSGRTLPNSSELLGSPRMKTLIDEMKARYKDDRIVIFDCPSLLSISDPLVISKYVDGVILVVEMENTKPDDLKRVLELLKDTEVFGTVLNKSKSHRGRTYV